MKRGWVILAIFLTGCGTERVETTKPELEPVTIEFFTPKEETKPIFDELIDDFEAENPHIKIEQVIVPNGMSVLKTRLARGNAPDLFITYPLEADYINRARKGYLLDLTDELFLDRIQPTIQTRYSVDGRMYGVAFTQNLVGVFYNKKDFEELHLHVPQTWDEWLQVMDTLKRSGKQPLLMANKEANQTSVFALNFVANAFPSSYWSQPDDIPSNPVWRKLTNQTEKVLSYVDPASFQMSYNDAMQAFVSGEGSMYVMGTWMLPLIETADPSFDFSIFPVPVSNDPNENHVLGGVDIGIGVSADTSYPQEAKLFLAFLTQEKNAQAIASYEGSMSTIIQVQNENEVMEPLINKVQDGETVNWPNHYWAGGTAAESDYRQYTLQFFYDRDEGAYLQNLDGMFKKYESLKSSSVEAP
ncbi:ABC transporter substrate-binding protein [Domibacillus enclensis]|uniref:Carbohydrate ABC transporter substrate-binding protein, CUT1 family n=1 Tax=Domibacillus enclensis TaxID=1017273 RepID=A0A1N6V618_9BACI|nr:extracellular solute-binding protein [Domibacillus enclensis]OXS78706.1 hypothetical protein B1B05_08940 [Domibacillus enclensis]SIQ73252.1 carbohydrate ABC transporter substrate-binding protein, CUT1 family [Domibacillus enclensis]